MKTQYKNRLQYIYLYSYSYKLTTGSDMSAGHFLIVLVKFGGHGQTSTIMDLKYSNRWSINLFYTQEDQMEIQNTRVCGCQYGRVYFYGITL